jgi:bifunctional non-homologous end joining protein LigD
MGLSVYNKKRNFKETPEPKGKPGPVNKFRFVVQRHEATRLHYDFRIELGKVLKSWAVPKGPSMNPADKRLAVQTEDHPVEYLSFHGQIPEGNYGAGKMTIWDSGVFFPINKDHEKISEKQAQKNIEGGELKLLLKGEKLEGEFVLVRLKDGKSWLMIKHKDEWAVKKTYDAEKLNPAKKKSTLKKSTATKTVKKKAAMKPAVKKKKKENAS